MHRPLLALQLVLNSFPRGDVNAGEPKIGRTRRLQIVPDRLAIGAKEFVAKDFPIHESRVHLLEAAAVAPDRPNAIAEVPGSLVANENLIRLSRRHPRV